MDQDEPTAHFSEDSAWADAALSGESLDDVPTAVVPANTAEEESQLSEVSEDQDRYMVNDYRAAVDILHLEELHDEEGNDQLMSYMLSTGADIRWDPERIDGFLAPDTVGRILDIIAEQFPTIRYPNMFHVKSERTCKIRSKQYRNQHHFAIHPWFYATRKPRQLGIQELETYIELPHTAGENQISFRVLLNLFRSRPNHYIYQSQMKIPYCGDVALLRAFTYLSAAVLVVSLLFGNIFRRDIQLEEVIGQGRITFWFQVTVVKPVDLDPKQLNKIVLTTELLTIPMSSDDDFPFVLAVATLFFQAWYTWKIESSNTGVEYFDLLDEDRDDGHVSEVSLFILTYPDRNAGCRGYFGNKYLHQTLMRHAYDPPARENNCFFYCIYKALGLPEGMQYARDDRVALCFSNDSKIFVSQLEYLCEYYHIYISLYHIRKGEDGMERIAHYKNYGNEKCDNRVSLLIKASHFCLLKNPGKIEQFRKCPHCYAWKNVTKNRGREHLKNCRKCPKCGLRWSIDHTCRRTFDYDETNQNRKRVQPVKEKRWIQFQGIKNVFVADFETFQPQELGEQVVYAAGYMEITDIKKLENRNTMRLCYGEDALDNFCNSLLNIRCNCLFVFYNGSRFDFWFILRWLLKHGVKIGEVLREKKSNKIMKLEFGRVKLWDLCLFSLCSLNELGRGLVIPTEYRKKEFDHKKIKTWEDVWAYKKEVEYYLYYDVLCLGLCHAKFVEKAWELYHFSAVKCVTLSHFAYQVWMNNFIEKENAQKIKLPTDEEYDFLRRGLFGGRCTPYRKAFRASGYLGYEQLRYLRPLEQSMVFNMMNDYLVLLDVVSLYPFVAKQAFPIGMPRWMNHEISYILSLFQRKSKEWADEELALIRRSFFEVDVKCPTWIPIPFLFSRGEKGNLVQDLKEKVKQVYDGETILEALILGYKVVNVHNWLLYPQYEVILDKYMTNCFESKAKAKVDGNDAEYLIHKIMANGCTGKFNQQVIDTEQHLFREDSWLQYMVNHEEIEQVKRIEWLRDEKDDHLGFYVEKEKDRDYSKPLQIGVCILSKSRVLMSEYTRKIGGYSTPDDVHMKNVPYYTDTDSLLVHINVYNKYKNCGIFGDKWGQLDNEFGPKAKIVAAYFPAPKTYALEYWILKDDGTIQVKWKIRAKGIPKGRDGSNETMCAGAKEFADLQESLLSIPMKPRELRELLFTLYSRDGKRISTTTTLSFYYFEQMMCNDCYVVVHFAKLRRFLVDKKGLGATVQFDPNLHRSINHERWWKTDKTAKRVVLGDSIWGPSVPRGHIALT